MNLRKPSLSCCGRYRDVQEVISKIESRFADKDFSEEGFEKSLQETYGAKKPTELQSDEFLMRFIEVRCAEWMNVSLISFWIETS